jgi:Flp pilus assembly protein TadD
VKFLTAYAYRVNNQPETAAALYQQLILQHPELPEPRNNLAMIYQARGDYDAASKLLVEAIETHESYATAYRNLGRIYTGIASILNRRYIRRLWSPTRSNG